MNETMPTTKKEPLSTFRIPIFINKDNLVATINKNIDDTIFEDNISEDNLQIVVKKVDSIQIAVQETVILYRVPLHIWVKKEMLLGDVAAEGDIIIDFQTNYQLNRDWSVETTTELLDYKWLKKPKASVLGFKIPVTAIAERILKSNAKTVTDAIDKQVNDSILIKSYAQQAWDTLQQPILISEDFEATFKFSPTNFELAPFQTQADKIVSGLLVKGKTELGVGASFTFPESIPLLPLQIRQFDTMKGIEISLLAQIPFAAIQRIALKNLKGQAYPIGTTELNIEDLKLQKVADALIISVQTQGLYNGWLSLKGTPAYDATKNAIEIQQIEFNLDTKNLFLKSTKWLLNGWLNNKLEGGLAYVLTDDIALLQEQLQNQLTNFALQEGIKLEGIIDTISVKNAHLSEEALLLNIQANGGVKVLVEVL